MECLHLLERFGHSGIGELMKNKQHKFILKAFLESKIPIGIRESENVFEFMSIDSVMGGYCTQALQGEKIQNFSKDRLISLKEKEMFAKLINELSGKKKDEMIIYYRLIILVEFIISQYS